MNDERRQRIEALMKKVIDVRREMIAELDEFICDLMERHAEELGPSVLDAAATVVSSLHLSLLQQCGVDRNRLEYIKSYIFDAAQSAKGLRFTEQELDIVKAVYDEAISKPTTPP